MAITIKEYFKQAQLSQAAYALGLLPGMSGAVDTTYTSLLQGGGMSAEQAKVFANLPFGSEPNGTKLRNLVLFLLCFLAL